MTSAAVPNIWNNYNFTMHTIILFTVEPSDWKIEISNTLIILFFFYFATSTIYTLCFIIMKKKIERNGTRNSVIFVKLASKCNKAINIVIYIHIYYIPIYAYFWYITLKYLTDEEMATMVKTFMEPYTF